MKIWHLAVLVFGMAAATATATEVPHPSGCPAESTWPLWNQMSWDSLITYNQCYSSQVNWGVADIPDHKISHSSGISMQFSTALAGAAASLKIGSVEYLHSAGHGAALQYAIHPQVPTSSYCGPNNSNCVSSECYNPTEAGSKTDDYRNMQGSQTSDLRAQMHGPSTSALWQDATYWKSGATSSYEWFRSWNRPAYFVPTGSSGNDGCVPHYPSGSPHNLGLTNYVLEKEVRLGPVQEGSYTLAPLPGSGEGFPVLGFSTDLFIGAAEATSDKFDTVLIAYLRDEFNLYYRHRASCGGLPGDICSCNTSGCLEILTTPAAPGVGGNDPLIIANGPNYAIGLFAVTPTNVVAGSGQHSAPYYWAIFDDGSQSGFIVRSLQVTYYSTTVVPGGHINYKAYYVVGSLGWVRYVLQELKTHPNITW